MASLSRIMGAGMTAAAPLMVEKIKLDLQEKEQQNLNDLRRELDAAGLAHDSAENEKDRALDSDRFQKEYDLQKSTADSELELSKQELGLRGKALQLDAEQQAKSLELIDEQIGAARLEREDALAVMKLRDEYAALDTSDPKNAPKAEKLVRSLQARGVKFDGDNDFKFLVKDTYDDEGYKTGSTLWRANTRSGEAEPLSGNDAGKPDPAALDSIMADLKDKFPGKSDADYRRRATEIYRKHYGN